MSEQRQYDEPDKPKEPQGPKGLKEPESKKPLIWPYAVLLAIVSGFAVLDFHKSVFHSFNCTTSTLAATNKASNGLYLDNQVIVRGPMEDVTTFAGEQGLTLLEGCDLSYLNTRDNPNQNLTEQQRKSLVMQLYEIPDDSNLTVEGVIGQIEEEYPTIKADPNYLTRLSDQTRDPCIRPMDGGGTGGGPYGDPYIPDPEKTNPATGINEVEQARLDFMNQWAFGPDGIDLPISSNFTGRGVRVAVFDTSPYRNRLPFLRWIRIAQPSSMWLLGWDATGPTTVSNHGLFVAGLIHRIAPYSTIHMVQVLDNNGCGQLWVLNKALEDYTSRISRWSGNLNRTVINMSLGIKMEDSQNRDDLDALQAAIDDAYDRGAVIIAAAGNDSPGIDEDGNTVVDPMPMQYPAKYSNVIGVAATNKDRLRSCYSNNGDVAAPGGDGRFTVTNDDGTTEEKCEPRADTWNQPLGLNSFPVCASNAPGNCPYIMISLAQTRNGLQYIYWSGTSFATPLVSGLAALIYQGSNSPDEVRDQIIDGAQSADSDLGAGIIDICDSLGLSPTSCP